MIDGTATIVGGAILGVSFIFSAHLVNVFVFLWVIYMTLVPFDVYTRIRIEKRKPVKDSIRTESKSNPMRTGISEKLAVAVYMAILAVIVYFMNGVMNGGELTCNIGCIGLSAVLNLFMGMFMVTELSSIIENLVEYNETFKRKNNPVIILLGKTLGVVYKNLEKRLNSKVDEYDNDKSSS